jgi:DNA invertase Pin-like site-specific DNA recombinase
MEDNFLEETGFGVIYTRVSTEMQLDGMGLEAQSKDCTKWCHRNEAKIKGVFSDQGKSGGYHESSKKNKHLINGLTLEQLNQLSPKEREDEIKISEIKGIEHRDQLKCALRTCKPGDMFVTYALTRLARNVEMAVSLIRYLKEKKVIIIFVKDGLDSRQASFKMTSTLLSMMAEMERDSMIDRVKSSMTLKRELGEFVGNIPFGYMLENGKQSDLIENPAEQEIIKLIKTLRDTKDTLGNPASFTSIAEELNKRELKTKNGKKWTHVQVMRIVKDKHIPQRTKGSYKAKLKSNNLEQDD